MGKLKYTSLKEFDQLNKAKSPKVEKQRKRYKEKFRQKEQRNRANEKIKKDYEKTKSKIKGKSRKQISNLWQNYQGRKKAIKYEKGIEFIPNQKRWAFPVDLELTNFDTAYKNIDKKGDIRSILVAVQFLNKEGEKVWISSSYPFKEPTLNEIKEFADAFIQNIPKDGSKGILVKILQIELIVYYKKK